MQTANAAAMPNRFAQVSMVDVPRIWRVRLTPTYADRNGGGWQAISLPHTGRNACATTNARMKAGIAGLKARST